MRIESWCEKRGKTLADLSRRSGVPKSTLQSIVAGGGTSADNAIKIIRATRGEVRLEDLTRRATAA